MNDQSTPVLVIGATSAAGGRVVDGLLNAGAAVIAVTNRVPDFARPNLTWLQQDPAQEYLRVRPHIVVCAEPAALPATARQARAMPSLRKLIALSSASVIFKRRCAAPDERQKVETLIAAEEELGTLAEKRGFGLVVLRPTLVYGGDGRSALDGVRAWFERRTWAPVAGRGLRQPVHADDLAELIKRVIGNDRAGVERYDLGGGETLPYPEFVRRIGASMGINARLVSIPAWIIAPVLRLAHRLGRLRAVTPEMVARQRMDLVVDDTPAREQLGWHPRAFRP